MRLIAIRRHMNVSDNALHVMTNNLDFNRGDNNDDEH